MNDHRYKRVSISLDRSSHDRCKALAHERTTSVSGLIRILIRNAFEEHEATKMTDDRPSIPSQ